jgi:hypothetical protein
VMSIVMSAILPRLPALGLYESERVSPLTRL